LSSSGGIVPAWIAAMAARFRIGIHADAASRSVIAADRLALDRPAEATRGQPPR
jgi:hypothetical protein